MLKRHTIGEDRIKLRKKVSHIVKAIEDGTASDTLKTRLKEIETKLLDLDQKQAALDKLYDFDKIKLDKKYALKWLTRLNILMNNDIIKARHELESLIGEFTLSPKIIDGIKFLRVHGSVKLDGLLMVAAVNSIRNIYNTGGDI